MQNTIKRALHELNHEIDGGADYEKTVEWLSEHFNIDSHILEQAYNDYVMSI